MFKWYWTSVSLTVGFNSWKYIIYTCYLVLEIETLRVPSSFHFSVFCRGEFHLTNGEDGVLSSAFMVGLLIASPIFASMAKR